MTKPELITKIAEKTNLSKKDAAAAMDAFISTITETLKAEGKVAIPSLGTFEIKERAARTGQLLARLEALGPEAVLRRGYVIARGTSGRPVTRVADVPEHMQLLFQDGTAQVRTLSTEGGNPFGSSQENL